MTEILDSIRLSRELTEETLQELIELFVPKDLGPNKDHKSGKPLLGVYLKSKESLEKSVKIFSTNSSLKGETGALLINIGSITRRLSPDMSKELENKFIIEIRDNLDYYEAGACLIHEIGHLVELLEAGETTDIFAEKYAIDIIFNKDLTFKERFSFLSYINFDYLETNETAKTISS